MTDHNGIDNPAYNNFGPGSTDPTPYMPPYPTSDHYMATYGYSGTGYAPPTGMDMPYGAPTPENNPYGSPYSPQDPYAPQNNYGSAGYPPAPSYYPSGYAVPQGQAPPAYYPYPPQTTYADPYGNYAPQPSYNWPAQADPYAPPQSQADPWQVPDVYRGVVQPQGPPDQASSYFGMPPSSGYYPPVPPNQSPPAVGLPYEGGAYPISSNEPQGSYASSAPPHVGEVPRFERRVFQASDIQRQQANSQQIYGYPPPQSNQPPSPYAETVSRSMFSGAEYYPGSEVPPMASPAMAPPAASPAMAPPAAPPVMAPPAASPAMAPPAAPPVMAPPAAPPAMVPPAAPPVMAPPAAPPVMAPPAAPSANAAEEQVPRSNLFDSPPAEPFFQGFSPASFTPEPTPPLAPFERSPESAASQMWPAPPPTTVLEPEKAKPAPEPPVSSAAMPEPMFFAPDFLAQMPPNASASNVTVPPAAEPVTSAPEQRVDAVPAEGRFDFGAPLVDPAAFSADGEAAPEATQPERPSPYEKNIFESDFTINSTEPAKMRQAQLGDTEIFRIAEELSQAVLVKSLNRAFNDNNLMPEGDPALVSIRQISSDYYVSESGGQPYRMFEDISFSLNAGCCCVLISDLPLVVYALARSICESADKGGPNEPVTVADLPDGYPGQVMYIGSDSMLPGEMTCKEFLLYTRGGGEEGPDVENERLVALFTQLGAGNLVDTDLRDLSYNKRILLLVLAAALNPNIFCVVVNDPKFSVGSEEEMLARRIFALINNRGKCSLISCASDHLMAAVANRVGVIKGGRLAFFDSYRRFLDEYCLGIMTFAAENPQEIAAALESQFPGINVLCKDNLVYIVRRKGTPEMPLEALISQVIHMGIDYSTIIMDDKSFAVACKEAFGR